MEKVLVIAEAGVNHNGSVELAKELVDVAAEAGADYVKFQTFKTELNISKSASKAKYQERNGKKETQFEMIKKLELDFQTHHLIKNYCDKKNIEYLSTAFDAPSLDFLDSLDQPFFKIPSGELVNLPFLKLIAKKNKPVVISTGMSYLSDIEKAINLFLEKGLTRDMITILHCNTEYPTPMQDVNLLAMNTIRDAFKVNIGYSDHTLGIEVPIAAVALGAQVIEKHFTIDKSLPGPDHEASLESGELIEMVTRIRNIEKALGNGIKKPSPSESVNIEAARKSIHISKDLAADHHINESDLTIKRPASGIPPGDFDKVIGKKLVSSMKEDEVLKWEHLK